MSVETGRPERDWKLTRAEFQNRGARWGRKRGCGVEGRAKSERKGEDGGEEGGKEEQSVVEGGGGGG